MKQEVCVIIPVYNRHQLLLRTLNAVSKQDLLPKRVIICDDGSTYDTLNICRRWIRKNRLRFETKVLTLPHKGAAAARNAGLKHQLQADDCDLVCFLDSDDIIPADFLKRCELFLRNHPDFSGACTPRLSVGTKTIYFDTLTDFVDDPICWMVYYGGALLSCSVLSLSKVASIVGFQEEFLTGHDILFLGKLLQLGPMKALPGRAVIMDRKLGRGMEEDSLSQTIPHSSVLGIRIRDILLKSIGESAILYRKYYHDAWYRACREQLRKKNVRLAIRYCINSIRYRPSASRPYLRLLLLSWILAWSSLRSVLSK